MLNANHLSTETFMVAVTKTELVSIKKMPLTRRDVGFVIVRSTAEGHNQEHRVSPGQRKYHTWEILSKVLIHAQQPVQRSFVSVWTRLSITWQPRHVIPRYNIEATFLRCCQKFVQFFMHIRNLLHHSAKFLLLLIQ